MAAAPDMWKALTDILAGVTWDDENDRPEIRLASRSDQITNARKAVAKASVPRNKG